MLLWEARKPLNPLNPVPCRASRLASVDTVLVWQTTPVPDSEHRRGQPAPAAPIQAIQALEHFPHRQHRQHRQHRPHRQRRCTPYKRKSLSDPRKPRWRAWRNAGPRRLSPRLMRRLIPVKCLHRMEPTRRPPLQRRFTLAVRMGYPRQDRPVKRTTRLLLEHRCRRTCQPQGSLLMCFRVPLKLIRLRKFPHIPHHFPVRRQRGHPNRPVLGKTTMTTAGTTRNG
mmetsp:Transcript_16001/g.60978  ORF Transcript_16001/g.60978 Transcript_16001/m.60978 type:complete len:226 (+) Transcript_16001:492-1169(+)